MKAMTGSAAPIAGLILLLAGCAGTGGTFYVKRNIGETSALLTTADLRLVTATPVESVARGGAVRPRQIVCAEPSPDVARAVQHSFGLGGAIGADIPAQARGEIALSIARARAEAVAQLGERLATIQLLRDGLYRACEALANGVLDQATYAVLLSRYDDTMITLLLGELAAGAFGRPLVAAGGSAGSKASAEGELQSLLERATARRTAATEADADLAKAEDELRAKESAGDTGAAEPARKNVEEKTRRALMAHKSATDAAAAATVAAVGGLDRVPSEKIAETLHDIQRKYIENINADALVVACITAMSQAQRGTPSVLSERCGAPDGFLAQILRSYQELLMAVKARHDLPIAVGRVNAARRALEGLGRVPAAPGGEAR